MMGKKTNGSIKMQMGIGFGSGKRRFFGGRIRRSVWRSICFNFYQGNALAFPFFVQWEISVQAVLNIMRKKVDKSEKMYYCIIQVIQ